MTDVILLILIALGVAVSVAVLNASVLRAWREDRRELAVLADRLTAEVRLQQLTVHTLQEMRDTARTSRSQP